MIVNYISYYLGLGPTILISFSVTFLVIFVGLKIIRAESSLQKVLLLTLAIILANVIMSETYTPILFYYFDYYEASRMLAFVIERGLFSVIVIYPLLMFLLKLSGKKLWVTYGYLLLFEIGWRIAALTIVEDLFIRTSLINTSIL